MARFRRFYWLTGNQELISAAVQRQQEIAAQTYIIMGGGASSTPLGANNQPETLRQRSQSAVTKENALLSGRVPDILSVQGSDCFVEFPPLISERDQKLDNDVF